MTNFYAPLGEAALGSAEAQLQTEDRARDALRRAVREATRHKHRQLDQAMSALNLNDRVGYGIFLNIHYVALSALASRWRAQDQPDFSALLCCLIEDLQALGFPASYPLTVNRTRAEFSRQWGIAYVIRGSRLGAQVLRQRLLAGSPPKAYLNHELKLPWSSFLRQFDEVGRRLPGERNHIIRGAKFAFATFIAAVGARE